MKKYIYFSATGSTAKVMELLGADSSCSINVTAGKPEEGDLSFASEDLLFFGFPVFGGRVPEIFLDRIMAIKGNGAKAIIVAVYGNRHYDDALKEMQAWAEAHGCEVVAAIAAVAQHSIAPSIAAGRPDAEDIARLQNFAEEINRKYLRGELKPLQQRPQGEEYKEYKQLPILPESTDACTLCGICAEECPVGAISIATSGTTYSAYDNDTANKTVPAGQATQADCITDPAKCILCMRCTAVCPSGARKLSDETLAMVTSRIENRCNGRRETEILYE